tara:strand:- start:604 stop:804 length:201 start_codon:yes stop_codon:yes gene_type:complete
MELKPTYWVNVDAEVQIIHNGDCDLVQEYTGAEKTFGYWMPFVEKSKAFAEFGDLSECMMCLTGDQ